MQRQTHRLVAERLADERVTPRLDGEAARFFAARARFVGTALQLADPREPLERLCAQRHVVQRFRAARALGQQRLTLDRVLEHARERVPLLDKQLADQAVVGLAGEQRQCFIQDLDRGVLAEVQVDLRQRTESAGCFGDLSRLARGLGNLA